jgi:polar amino acid transport system permease protein
VTSDLQAAYQRSERQLERLAYRRRRATKGIAVATVSTLVVAVVAAYGLTHSPGWPRVQETFFSRADFTASFPDVLSGLWLNVKIFLIGEVCILALGLAIAVTRSVRTPALFPLRAMAVVYVDVFRGIPLLLVVFLVGFGVPALNLTGITNDPVVLATTALVLSYSAYVAEVFRSGIDSIHPSQRSAARALGLKHHQAMRHVVLPQAVRRVIPPLLNDFVSLQKDSALVAVVGPLEAVRQAQIYAAGQFNYTSYVAAALLFIALTIPLARLTDRIAARTARRQGPGGLA